MLCPSQIAQFRVPLRVRLRDLDGGPARGPVTGIAHDARAVTAGRDLARQRLRSRNPCFFIGDRLEVRRDRGQTAAERQHVEISTLDGFSAGVHVRHDDVHGPGVRRTERRAAERDAALQAGLEIIRVQDLLLREHGEHLPR